MYVCIHIYIYIYIRMCIYIYTYIYIYICIYVCVHIYIYIYICAHIYIYSHTYTHTHAHLSLSLCIYIYIYTSLSLHIYIYIYIYIHCIRCCARQRRAEAGGSQLESGAVLCGKVRFAEVTSMHSQGPFSVRNISNKLDNYATTNKLSSSSVSRPLESALEVRKDEARRGEARSGTVIIYYNILL